MNHLLLQLKLNAGQRTVVAVGSEAKKMLGRTPGNISAIRPLKRWSDSRFSSNRRNVEAFYRRSS